MMSKEKQVMVGVGAVLALAVLWAVVGYTQDINALFALSVGAAMYCLVVVAFWIASAKVPMRFEALVEAVLMPTLLTVPGFTIGYLSDGWLVPVAVFIVVVLAIGGYQAFMAARGRYRFNIRGGDGEG